MQILLVAADVVISEPCFDPDPKESNSNSDTSAKSKQYSFSLSRTHSTTISEKCTSLSIILLQVWAGSLLPSHKRRQQGDICLSQYAGEDGGEGGYHEETRDTERRRDQEEKEGSVDRSMS